MPRVPLIILALITCLPGVYSQQAEPDSASLAELYQSIDSYYDSLDASFTYATDTTVALGNGFAAIDVPEGFLFLDGEQSEFVLVELWENPPTEPENRSLGMLFPETSGPLDPGGYAINITFARDGYIDDTDADAIDFAQLLNRLREDTRLESDSLEVMGYGSVELVGWAQSPFYDVETKKLHWALDLKFGDMEEHVLNYNIRMLGRYGYIKLNVIGDMESLADVNQAIDRILSSIRFREGYRYEDFRPGEDPTAGYGITSLIAGREVSEEEFQGGNRVSNLSPKSWIAMLAVLGIGALAFFLVRRRKTGN